VCVCVCVMVMCAGESPPIVEIVSMSIDGVLLGWHRKKHLLQLDHGFKCVSVRCCVDVCVCVCVAV